MTVPRSCEICDHSPLLRSQRRFCSQACYGEFNRRAAFARRPTVTCDHCGGEFKRPKGSSRRTCSRNCRYALVSATHKALGTVPPGLPPEVASERITGPNAPWWKGGRTVTKRGYVLVLAPDDWPWPEMVGAQGRIREHRMVMARHLGRPLTRKEVVHHLNGERADNRLENLELWESHSAHMRGHHGHGKH